MRGQALVETALVVPFLLVIALNVVNFGYLFLVALNLTSASRSGALYSIIGEATPASASPSFTGLPPATSAGCPSGTPNCSVSDLAYGDLTGAIYLPTTATVGVCSTTIGISGTGTGAASSCTGTGTAPSDLEKNSADTAPMFYVNRVDVTYQFNPPIPGFAFNLFDQVIPACGSSGQCTFHRAAVMREMN